MAFLPKSGHFRSKLLVIALIAHISIVLYRRQSGGIHFAIVGCVSVLQDRAAKVCHMRAPLLVASFFTAGGVGSLWIGKGSPLASHSEARASAFAMSWVVVMLWD